MGGGHFNISIKVKGTKELANTLEQVLLKKESQAS